MTSRANLAPNLLPQLSKLVSAAGAKEQQAVEQIRGTYPGAANDATSKSQQQRK